MSQLAPSSSALSRRSSVTSRQSAADAEAGRSNTTASATSTNRTSGLIPFSVVSLLVEWSMAGAGASPPPDPRAGDARAARRAMSTALAGLYLVDDQHRQTQSRRSVGLRYAPRSAALPPLARGRGGRARAGRARLCAHVRAARHRAV